MSDITKIEECIRLLRAARNRSFDIFGVVNLHTSNIHHAILDLEDYKDRILREENATDK